ncbi:MAG: hypothetical protein K0V04_43665 [Deltaproteobacteria bacterium]|nr:hypothetical protein [Deltaproteobacteria bacterium]
MPAQIEPYAGLTLAALGGEASAWIEAYQRELSADEDDLTRPEDGFLDFVIANTDRSIPRRIALFERAVSTARMARHDHETLRVSDGRLRLHRAACVIDMPGPADQVIATIALGLPVPAYTGWPVLVAPGLPTLWRQASPAENAVCTWLTRPRQRDAVLERFSGVEHVLQRLLDARAITDGT